MLEHVATRGLDGVPVKWFHEASKEEKIYEFIKGPFRVFFFKGEGTQIAVCTSHARKSGKKADKKSVAHAARLRTAYMSAVQTDTLRVEIDDDA